MVVLDGLRTVLERNCSYVCKSEAEPAGDSEQEPAHSRRESRWWPLPSILKVCVVCVCVWGGRRKCVCVCVRGILVMLFTVWQGCRG